jgi:hypothetical protein
LLGFFLGGVGNDDATGRFLLFFHSADDHAVSERAKLHCALLLKKVVVF